MKNLLSILALAFLASFTEGENMADIGPMRESVGIRQVTHNGVKLPPAMRLAVTGGTLTAETADDGVVTYKLDLSGSDASAAAIISLENRVAKLEAGLQVPDAYIAPGGFSSFTATVGATHQTDLGMLGFDEGVSVQLPDATTTNKGQTITVVEVSGNALSLSAPLGGGNAYLRILPPLGQPLRGAPTNGAEAAYYLKTSLGNAYPFATFRSTGDAWVCVSRSSF